MKISSKVLVAITAMFVSTIHAGTNSFTITHVKADGVIKSDKPTRSKCTIDHSHSHCHKDRLACTKRSKGTEFKTVCIKPDTTTHTWQEPTVVTQVVVQQIVQKVVEQPQLRIPHRITFSFPVFFSAHASVNTGGYGYNPTYWQEDSIYQERINIANTRATYRGGHYGNYRGGYGGPRLTGENYNSGIRSFPRPVNINRPQRR